jgi:hypothetical protein
MSDNYDERPFRGTKYEYKVSLGTVMDEDCLSWESHVYCKEWSDVDHLIEAWNEARDFPAVEVNAAWRPTADHKNAE